MSTAVCTWSRDVAEDEPEERAEHMDPTLRGGSGTPALRTAPSGGTGRRSRGFGSVCGDKKRFWRGWSCVAVAVAVAAVVDRGAGNVGDGGC